MAPGPACAPGRTRWGDQRISHLEPAFGTEFLYFAGYRRVPSGLAPVILVKNTGIAVQRLTGHRCPYVQVSTDNHLGYLQVLHVGRFAAG